MATLKEFEDALRSRGMSIALGILNELRERDRAERRATPARRVTGRKMTPDMARRIRHLHATTQLTQQEIAFNLGVNQGRVNEVIKRGKWLDGNPASLEAQRRDAALAKARHTPRQHFATHKRPAEPKPRSGLAAMSPLRPTDRAQLSFGGL